MERLLKKNLEEIEKLKKIQKIKRFLKTGKKTLMKISFFISLIKRKHEEKDIYFQFYAIHSTMMLFPPPQIMLPPFIHGTFLLASFCKPKIK
jgi:hypothetical protein